LACTPASSPASTDRCCRVGAGGDCRLPHHVPTHALRWSAGWNVLVDVPLPRGPSYTRPMAKFGVKALKDALRVRSITLPRNVLAYGFSVTNKPAGASRLPPEDVAEPVNVTLQSKEGERIERRVRSLGKAGYATAWFMHLDDVDRGPAEGLHEGDEANAVRLLQLPTNLGMLPLNVTMNEDRGVVIRLDALVQAEVARIASLERDAVQAARIDAEDGGAFDLPAAADERKRTLASIVVRQGQPAFRAALLAAYDRRCAISACDCEDVLEAAHIRPYSGPASNTTANGLLLRADIHTLFDLGLVLVGADLKVRVAQKLRAGPYASFHERDLVRTPAPPDGPSLAALAEHERFSTLAHTYR
jgi:HNH endonuclease